MTEHQKRILIVEDDTKLRSILVDAFTADGMEVKEAVDGVQAIEQVESYTPHLVLLDIVLPRKDGLSVVKELRTNPALKDVPIILLTNLASASDVEKALSSGATNYLVKSDYTVPEIVERAKGFLPA